MKSLRLTDASNVVIFREANIGLDERIACEYRKD